MREHFSLSRVRESARKPAIVKYCGYFFRPPSAQAWGSHCNNLQAPPQAWEGHCENLQVLPQAWGRHCENLQVPPQAWEGHCGNLQVLPQAWGRHCENLQVLPQAWFSWFWFSLLLFVQSFLNSSTGFGSAIRHPAAVAEWFLVENRSAYKKAPPEASAPGGAWIIKPRSPVTGGGGASARHRRGARGLRCQALAAR
jgi:hypothetical protein